MRDINRHLIDVNNANTAKERGQAQSPQSKLLDLDLNPNLLKLIRKQAPELNYKLFISIYGKGHLIGENIELIKIMDAVPKIDKNTNISDEGKFINWLIGFIWSSFVISDFWLLQSIKFHNEHYKNRWIVFNKISSALSIYKTN